MDCSTSISFDEMGDLRCSDFDLPLFTSESLVRVFMFHFSNMKKTQWESMKDGIIDADTFVRLFSLCQDLVETVHTHIVDSVAPHIRNPAGDCSANKSVTMNEIGSCNYHTVTEEDVEASLGNSLYQCLGEVVGVVEEKSKYSEELLQLVAEDVAERVNCTLAFTRQTAPFQGLDMISKVVKILTRCLLKKDQHQVHLEKPDNAFGTQYLDGRSTEPFSSPEPDDETMFEEFGTEKPANAFSTQYLDGRSTDSSMFEKISLLDFDDESMVEFGTEEPDNKLMFEEFNTEEPEYELIFEEFSSEDSDGESMVEFSTEEPDNELMVEEFGTEKPTNEPKVDEFNTEEPEYELIFEEFSSEDSDGESMVEFSTEEPDNKLMVEEFGTEKPTNEPKVEEFITKEPENDLMVQDFSSDDFDLESTDEFTKEEPGNDLMVEKFGVKKTTNEPKVEVLITREPENDLVLEDFSSLDFDVESMVEFCTEEPDIKTMVEEFSSKGSIDSSLPSTQTQEFGSAKLEETIQKSPSFVKKVRTFFRRKSKVTPVCDVALLEKKQKCSAVIGMFGSVARILRKPFTSCISCGSRDD
ncbi:uncharacterized protein LOC119498211 isoform X2 [Sebastes umbrosus]|uniref:uncharacterized protein LOC119498211 isoform X1 n=1 Tax=Sebastes umbrosus TaxID=72105 RepID=UPI00189DA0A8|nr:uncharacterized protein LOC119498211 isoform X1 [Sebastes umbrosus]XP_037642886.1 uncharacterized protein LOC119498211 isoform X2 [Sebastes umbrosus]